MKLQECSKIIATCLPTSVWEGAWCITQTV